MRNKFLITFMLAASVLMIAATGCAPKAPEAIKAGDAVLALWSGGSTWWLGTADTACTGGLNVKWADGSSPSCTAMSGIVREVQATKDTAVVGANVYARWSGTSFYKAKVTAVAGDKYSIEYSDGSKKDDLALGDLRMQ